MIIGLGSDIVDVRRIADVIERHGERFLGRIFTATERAKADQRANSRRNLRQAVCREGSLRQGAWHGVTAGRFLARYGRGQRAGGRPTMKLTGGALSRLQALTPPGL